MHVPFKIRAEEDAQDVQNDGEREHVAHGESQAIARV